MNKKVTFGARPAQLSPDAWVGDRTQGEAMKRLTLDIPATLHGRIKSACALKGEKMVDEIRKMLEREFPPA